VQQKLPRGLRAATLAAAVAVAAAYLPARAAETEVKIDNFSFAPERITVKAGTTITWINEDDIPHTVASSAKPFKSKALDTDDKYSFTFTTPGTYEYFCSLHPHMTGTVVVEVETGSNAADGPSLAPSGEAAPEQRPR
jgi:amicyanin